MVKDIRYYGETFMKKKCFITVIVIDIMILLCSNINAAEFDTDEITIYAAGLYNEGIAPILFEWDELLYKGYINEQGKLLFYVEWNYDDEYDEQFWDVLEWDFDELNDATFEGGYSWFEKDDKRYIINTAGEIVSSYNCQDVLCTGGGYTWVVAGGEASWDDPGTYSFILYKPNGKVETSLDFDFNKYESWELDDLRYELENYAFHYLGQGVFCSKYYDKFYFVKSGNWVNYDNVQWFYEDDDWLGFDENKYVVLDFDKNDEGGAYVAFIDVDGILQKACISEINIYDYKLKGISENYILFSDGESFCYFDLREKCLYRYSGKYDGYIYEYMTYTHGEVNNSYMAFAISGADENEYVALINCNTLEELDPIYIKDRDAFSLKQDVLVVENDMETQLLDFQGNILSEYDSEGKAYYIDHGLVMCISEDEYDWPEYYYYDGMKLFEEYDFSDAIDLGMLAD